MSASDTLEDYLFHAWTNGWSIGATVVAVMRMFDERLTFEEIRQHFAHFSHNY